MSKSHVFTAEEARSNADPTLNELATLDPQYDTNYAKDDYQDGVEVREQSGKDLRRTAVGCFKLTDERSNITVDLMQEYDGRFKSRGQENDYGTIYDNMKSILTDHGLSEPQAAMVLREMQQQTLSGGGMANAGPLLIDAINSVQQQQPGNEIMFNVRQGAQSLITIDADGNVSQIGGTRIIFDCSQMVSANNIYYDQDAIKTNLNKEYKSNDDVIINVKVQMGQLGNADIVPTTVIEFAGQGPVGTTMVEYVKHIKSTVQPKEPQEIVEKYHQFASATHEDGVADQYQQVIKAKIGAILAPRDGELPPKMQQELESLRKLKYTNTAIAEVITEQIIDGLGNAPKKADGVIHKAALEPIRVALTTTLTRVLDPEERRKANRFAGDLIRGVATATETEITTQSIKQKLISGLKAGARGYSTKSPPGKDLGKDIINKAREIGAEIKSQSGRREAIVGDEAPSLRKPALARHDTTAASRG